MQRKYTVAFVCGFLISLCLAWTYTWDCATPVGTDAPSVIDDRIREVKYATAERFNVDHYAPLTGTQVSDTAAGQHRKVEFYGPISTPTYGANKGFLYTKDVSDKAELCWLDEDDDELQITSGGILKAVNLTGTQTVAGAKTFSDAATFSSTVASGSTVTGTVLVSTQATGTAPLTVASTTKVTNLNADQVDGYDVAAYAGGQSYTFPGGLILKQGTVSVGPSGQTVTFESAFPTAIISVQLTIQYTSWNTHYAPILTTAPTTAAIVMGVGNITRTVHWQAWGY